MMELRGLTVGWRLYISALYLVLQIFGLSLSAAGADTYG